MLRGIHKASANWIGRAVMGVILGLIAISFGIWGIGDIFKGFGTSTVAKVGGTEIRVDTFRQLYQDRLQQLGRQLNRPILPDQARALGLDRQLLGEVIAETALDERARALRLNVSDAEIARQVTDMPGFKGITGQFDRARFEAVLRNMGYTEARLLSEQRRDRAPPATARHRQRRGAGAENRAGGVQPLPERRARPSSMSRSARRRPATSPSRRPRCSPSISRSARSCSARRSTARSRLWCSRRKIWRPGSKCRMPT